MRIEVVESIPEIPAASEEAIEEPSVKLARQNFQSALRGEDSMVDTQEIGVGPAVARHGGQMNCVGDFLLTFRDEDMRNSRSMNLQLIRRLIELLKNVGSQETQRATVCMVRGGAGEIPKGAGGLKIRLEASGDTREQAALRWGLGLAHLQQALLFTFRYLRQQGPRKEG